MDSTGAEYRLGVHSPDGQVWSSQEGSGYKSYAFRAGAPGAIVRTYTNTYLTGSNYTSRYIFNRLLTSTLSGGGQGMTLVTNTYDGTSRYLAPPGPPPAPRRTGRSTYSISPPINTATTNGHWTRTTMDGLGRTVRVTRPGYLGALLPLDPAGR